MKNRGIVSRLCCIAAFAVMIIIQAVTISELNNAANSSEGGAAINETPVSSVEAPGSDTAGEPDAAAPDIADTAKAIVVIDPGHGKSSWMMTDEEKAAAGYVLNSNGQWGDWRHWKSGSIWVDCEGSGCNGRASANGSCWYPIENGDRDTEPEIDLANAMAAAERLESMGYEVRMTRTTNEENPSLTQRLKKCYPNDDINSAPDAAVYVCIHSNAGGGRGSAYLALNSGYDHIVWTDNYAEAGNELGRMINDRIVTQTSMPAYADGSYSGQSDLVLFHKSPIPVAYMEIGFYDNASDLSILQSESTAIGYAIADGINDYIEQNISQ